MSIRSRRWRRRSIKPTNKPAVDGLGQNGYNRFAPGQFAILTKEVYT
jgi:hypothetical protein